MEEALTAVDPALKATELWDPTYLVSSTPNLILARMAAKCVYVDDAAMLGRCVLIAVCRHVKVVLTGEGADELFAGYEHFERAPSAAELQAECQRTLRKMHNEVRNPPKPVATKRAVSLTNSPQILQRVDRTTMACSLEARVPFLDQNLVDLVMLEAHASLKWTHTQAAHPGQPRDARPMEKELLRNALLQRYGADVLPHEVLWRRKVPFGDGADTSRSLRHRLESQCAVLVSDRDMATAASTYALFAPRDKLSLHCRQVFEDVAPGAATCSGSWVLTDGICQGLSGYTTAPVKALQMPAVGSWVMSGSYTYEFASDQ